MTDPNIILPLSIKVNLHAGTHIDHAAGALIDLANHLNCMIEGGFNGVTLIATPRDDAARLVAEFHRVLNDKTIQHKIASDRGE